MSSTEVAKAIAIAAHAGQVDKNGDDYIGHPERVAKYVEASGAGEAVIAVAWLHDVLEDTRVDRRHLSAAGMPSTVIDAVETLTRIEGQAEDDYYEGIRWAPTAKKVKLADIRDNTDPRRLALLDEKTQLRLIRKYAKALHAIHGTTPKEPA